MVRTGLWQAMAMNRIAGFRFGYPGGWRRPAVITCMLLLASLGSHPIGSAPGPPQAGPAGEDTSALVQIDHVVALSDAWQKGAAGWTAVKRIEFANDPRNLQAVSGAVNQQKSDGDAATWLPPNKSYRCTYVSRQIEVKKSYGLWVTPAERDAMSRVLASC